MKHKKKKATEAVLKKVWEILAGLPAKQSGPSLYSPLSSIDHPDGWKSVMMLIFEKNYNFGEIVEALSTAWPEALAEVGIKDKGKTPLELSKEKSDEEIGICTEQALRRRVREVALDRHRQATLKLSGELSPVEEKGQRAILEEAGKLMKRFDWSLEPASEPEAKPAKRKSRKNKTGGGASDSVASPGHTNGTESPAVSSGAVIDPGSAPQEQSHPAESIMLPAPPTDTPEPKFEASPEGAGVGGSTTLIGAVEKPVEVSRSGKEKSATTTETTPLCPDCNSPMRIKEAGKGINKGKKFYGCSAFPNCKATRSFEG